MTWKIEGEDPVTLTFAGKYLLDRESGEKAAYQILDQMEGGKRVILDLDNGTHCIHHHFYYGLIGYCIKMGKQYLFTPGNQLTVIEPAGSILKFSYIVNMYREKGCL